MLLNHSACIFLYSCNFKIAMSFFFLLIENEDNGKINDQVAVWGLSMALCGHTAFVTICTDKMCIGSFQLKSR